MPTMGFRYKSFPLSDTQDLILRTEVDAYAKGNAMLRALHEFDPKVSFDWRSKLETQRGAVVATELKNNSAKLARWTCQAMLGGLDTIKLGYYFLSSQRTTDQYLIGKKKRFVARDTLRNVSNHTLLAVQTIKPGEFCDQISLNMRNCWGILKSIIALVEKQEEDGKFVLVKDPMKNMMRFYAIPAGASIEKALDADEGVPNTEEQPEQ